MKTPHVTNERTTNTITTTTTTTATTPTTTTTTTTALCQVSSIQKVLTAKGQTVLCSTKKNVLGAVNIFIEEAISC